MCELCELENGNIKLDMKHYNNYSICESIINSGFIKNVKYVVEDGITYSYKNYQIITTKERIEVYKNHEAVECLENFKESKTLKLVKRRIDSGFYDLNSQKEAERKQNTKKWIAIKDEKTCNYCVELDGQIKALWARFFIEINGRMYSLDAPPLHWVFRKDGSKYITCRCRLEMGTRIVGNKSKAQEVAEEKRNLKSKKIKDKTGIKKSNQDKNKNVDVENKTPEGDDKIVNTNNKNVVFDKKNKSKDKKKDTKQKNIETPIKKTNTKDKDNKQNDIKIFKKNKQTNSKGDESMKQKALRETFKSFFFRNNNGWKNNWSRTEADGELSATEFKNDKLNTIIRLDELKTGKYIIKIFKENRLSTTQEYDSFDEAKEFIKNKIKNISDKDTKESVENRLKKVVESLSETEDNSRAIRKETDMFNSGSDEYLRILNLIVDNENVKKDIIEKAKVIRDIIQKTL